VARNVYEIPTIIAVNKSINKNKNKTQEFDMIILDTHLKDIPYVQVAKEIVNRTLDQRIIFTTTSSFRFTHMNAIYDELKPSILHYLS
jgi:response regulator of citrate/malate metabolism